MEVYGPYADGEELKLVTQQVPDSSQLVQGVFNGQTICGGVTTSEANAGEFVPAEIELRKGSLLPINMFAPEVWVGDHDAADPFAPPIAGDGIEILVASHHDDHHEVGDENQTAEGKLDCLSQPELVTRRTSVLQHGQFMPEAWEGDHEEQLPPASADEPIELLVASHDHDHQSAEYEDQPVLPSVVLDANKINCLDQPEVVMRRTSVLQPGQFMPEEWEGDHGDHTLPPVIAEEIEILIASHDDHEHAPFTSMAVDDEVHVASHDSKPDPTPAMEPKMSAASLAEPEIVMRRSSVLAHGQFMPVEWEGDHAEPLMFPNTEPMEILIVSTDDHHEATGPNMLVQGIFKGVAIISGIVPEINSKQDNSTHGESHHPVIAPETRQLFEAEAWEGTHEHVAHAPPEAVDNEVLVASTDNEEHDLTSNTIVLGVSNNTPIIGGISEYDCNEGHSHYIHPETSQREFAAEGWSGKHEDPICPPPMLPNLPLASEHDDADSGYCPSSASHRSGFSGVEIIHRSYAASPVAVPPGSEHSAEHTQTAAPCEDGQHCVSSSNVTQIPVYHEDASTAHVHDDRVSAQDKGILSDIGKALSSLNPFKHEKDGKKKQKTQDSGEIPVHVQSETAEQVVGDLQRQLDSGVIGHSSMSNQTNQQHTRVITQNVAVSGVAADVDAVQKQLEKDLQAQLKQQMDDLKKEAEDFHPQLAPTKSSEVTESEEAHTDEQGNTVVTRRTKRCVIKSTRIVESTTEPRLKIIQGPTTSSMFQLQLIFAKLTFPLEDSVEP